jgi:predicted PurR-regulated permease PerM
MSDTRSERSSHPVPAALGWAVVILVGSMVPGGGLIAAIAAVLTTYKASNLGVKMLWLAVGVLTLLVQLSTFFALSPSGSSSPEHRVQ